MIDIHSHILPGFDDGAGTLDDSMAIAQMAHSNGIRQMIATPHQILPLPRHLPWRSGWDQSTVADETAKLQDSLNQVGIDLVLHPGAEIHLVSDLPERLARGEACKLNGSRYLLLEFPFAAYPAYSEKVVIELLDRGLVPIIAHPERCNAFKRESEQLAALVERGALVQLTAASVTGGYGHEVKEAADGFLSAGLAHIIATDTHGIHHRAPVLSNAVGAAADIIGEEQAQAMVTGIPEAIVLDEPVSTVANASDSHGFSKFRVAPE